MTKTKTQTHTPGPWSILDLEDGELDILYGSESDLAQVTDQVVATVRIGRKTEANARLIANAPALLEAAKEALEHVGVVKIGRGIEAMAAEAKLRAAIAKAEGSQT